MAEKDYRKKDFNINVRQNAFKNKSIIYVNKFEMVIMLWSGEYINYLSLTININILLLSQEIKYIFL